MNAGICHTVNSIKPIQVREVSYNMSERRTPSVIADLKLLRNHPRPLTCRWMNGLCKSLAKCGFLAPNRQAITSLCQRKSTDAKPIRCTKTFCTAQIDGLRDAACNVYHSLATNNAKAVYSLPTPLQTLSRFPEHRRLIKTA